MAIATPIARIDEDFAREVSSLRALRPTSWGARAPLVVPALVLALAGCGGHSTSPPAESGVRAPSANAASSGAAAPRPVRANAASSRDVPSARPTSRAAVRALAVGARSCALHDDGAVSCWGRGFGAAPVRFDGFDGAVELTASAADLCARTANGAVRCLRVAEDPTPVAEPIPLTRPAVAIRGACARAADGTISCWSKERNPERYDAVDVTGVTGAVHFDASHDVGCAIGSDDKVVCWRGGGVVRQLKEKLPDVAEIAVASHDHACARLGDGTVTCWGSSFQGSGRQMMPSPAKPYEPRRIPGLRDVASLAASGGRVCATKNDGAVVCWHGAREPKLEPVAGIEGARGIATASDHGCALTGTGGVACWGNNAYGGLGIGLDVVRAKPEPVAKIDDAIAVHAADEFTCALRAGGKVSCWGKFRLFDDAHPQIEAREIDGLRDVAQISGRIGLCVRQTNGTIACSDGPERTRATKVVAVPAANAFDVDLVGCAVATGGLHCWGSNRDGQFGDGTHAEGDAKGPGARGISDVMSVAVGAFHTTVVRKTGSLATFGKAIASTFGDALVLAPREVPMPGPVASAAAGIQSTCAVLQDGRVACFGRNEEGVLGDGTTTFREDPVVVAGLDHATKVTIGADTACALAGGKVWCWGANRQGQVGPLGARPRQLRPVLVPDLPDAVDVSSGGRHTCAVTRNRAVYCWGSTVQGESGGVASFERREATALTFGR